MNQRKKEDLAAIQHLFGLTTPEQAESFDAFMKTMFPPKRKLPRRPRPRTRSRERRPQEPAQSRTGEVLDDSH